MMVRGCDHHTDLEPNMMVTIGDQHTALGAYTLGLPPLWPRSLKELPMCGECMHGMQTLQITEQSGSFAAWCCD